MFTEKERAYLNSQPLARLATVSPSGQPDADVVSFELDGDDILIGSYQNLAGSRKYKNVAAGGDMVSLVIDSLASVDPMDQVAVKIHGTASIEHRSGKFGPAEYIGRPAADTVELRGGRAGVCRGSVSAAQADAGMIGGVALPPTATPTAVMVGRLRDTASP